MIYSPQVLDKLSRLKDIIKKTGRTAIAFSGGVDSSFLLQVAVDLLPSDVLAVMAVSELLPSFERKNARSLIITLGVPFLEIEFSPLFWPEFVNNPPDRCYYCKKNIYTLCREKIAVHNFTVLMDGTNCDDLREDRPGHRAIDELGIMTPLATAGFTKAEIRQLSRQWGLPTWNRPSSSCFATRIPHGTDITAEKLSLVAQGESFLYGLGLSDCRVRWRGNEIHVEVKQGDFVRLSEFETREAISDFFASLGIHSVLVNIVERK